MKSQRGFIGKGLADAMAAMIIATSVISAFVGWALIEGMIWICKHITIDFVG